MSLNVNTSLSIIAKLSVIRYSIVIYIQLLYSIWKEGLLFLI